MIRKNNPSTCETLHVNQKVKEWIKGTQMSPIDEYCGSLHSAANEEMLNYVYGYKWPLQINTQITSESTFDSGFDNELDSSMDKSASKQKTSLYTSHQEVEDMFSGQTDETDQPNLQNNSNR